MFMSLLGLNISFARNNNILLHSVHRRGIARGRFEWCFVNNKIICTLYLYALISHAHVFFCLFSNFIFRWQFNDSQNWPKWRWKMCATSWASVLLSENAIWRDHPTCLLLPFDELIFGTPRQDAQISISYSWWTAGGTKQNIYASRWIAVSLFDCRV